MLHGFFFFLHLVIAFLMVVVVLLQRSKGGGLSGAFGGVGAGDAAFGNVGVTTFLHKTTIYLAIGFMVTSLTLAYLTAQQSSVSPGGAPVGGTGETVLPVGNTPVMPDETMPAAGDTTFTEDAIVPGADDIVPADPAGEEAATDTTTTGGDGSGGR